VQSLGSDGLDLKQRLQAISRSQATIYVSSFSLILDLVHFITAPEFQSRASIILLLRYILIRLYNMLG